MNCCLLRIARLALVVACSLLASLAHGARELVILDGYQTAQRLEGVVLDPSGGPIAEMTVSDNTSDWKTILRSTRTDSKGRFHFSRQSGKTIYYLRFDHQLFNPLELKLKLDKNTPQRGITVRPHIGG